MKIKNIAGLSYGTLTVIERTTSNKYGKARWVCQCSCGRTKIVSGNDLQMGNVKSCGCRRWGFWTKHGETVGGVSRFYSVWAGMLDRCRNKKNKRYKVYGGRGIIVCKRWYDFSNFKNDMHDAYINHFNINNGDTYIDRMNNDLSYTPENCRWATQRQQQNNRSNNCRLSLQSGETHTIAEWARIYGVSSSVLYKRFALGWDAQRILTTIIRK